MACNRCPTNVLAPPTLLQPPPSLGLNLSSQAQGLQLLQPSQALGLNLSQAQAPSLALLQPQTLILNPSQAQAQGLQQLQPQALLAASSHAQGLQLHQVEHQASDGRSGSSAGVTLLQQAIAAALRRGDAYVLSPEATRLLLLSEAGQASRALPAAPVAADFYGGGGGSVSEASAPPVGMSASDILASLYLQRLAPKPAVGQLQAQLLAQLQAQLLGRPHE